MKKITIAVFVLLLVCPSVDASLFNMNGLKKNFTKNFNFFGMKGQHHHHSNGLEYFAQLPPERPKDPNQPTVPPLDPIDPGIPVLPVTPITPNPVPEPASMLLLSSGLMVLWVAKRKINKRKS